MAAQGLARNRRPHTSHQANAGQRTQPVRCNDTSALKCASLRRFYGDGFIGISPKTPILTPIHAKSARQARPRVL